MPMSGIFIVSADMSRALKSPGLLLVSWIIAAVMTILAALSYGELAAAMPHAGGQYVFLREAFGPLFGFLHGWTLFLVIQTGTIAAVVVAFAKFIGLFVPWISASNILIPFPFGYYLSSQHLIAILVLCFTRLGLTQMTRESYSVMSMGVRSLTLALAQDCSPRLRKSIHNESRIIPFWRAKPLRL